MIQPVSFKKLGGKIVLATHNKGKVREIADLMRPLGVEVVSAGELGLPEPVEDAPDFAGNARIKALASARAFTPRAGPRNQSLKAAGAILIWRCGM